MNLSPMSGHSPFWRGLLICAVAPLFWLSTAQASESFPYELKKAAGMACTPRCSICHMSDPGRQGTAGQDFAIAMAGAGLKAGDESTVAPAFEAIKAGDIDGDGFTEEQELSEVTAPLPSDPNNIVLTPDNPGDGMCDAEVMYGCGAHVAENPKPDGSSALAAMVAGLLLLAFRSRQRQG